MYITTKVVSSNPAHGQVHLIQHYVVVCQWFSPGIPFSTTNRTDCHDITEILLKVALNAITLTLSHNGMNNVESGTKH